MKFLIPFLCLFFGFAAADLLQKARPLVDDAVGAFMEGMDEGGSLRLALGMPDAYELDRVERDIKTELGKELQDALNKVLDEIKDHVDHGKEVAKGLYEKAKKFRDQLKDLHKDIGDKAKEVVEKIKDKAKDVWRELKEKLGIGKRNLDLEYDVVARSKFSELIERIKEKILSNENIRKIREYIRNFVTSRPVINAFKEFLLKLKDVDFKELIREMFQHKRDSRGVKEMWEKVKEVFDKLKESLKEKTSVFRDWFKGIMDAGFEKLKEKHGLIKAMVLEFISHAKEIHGEVAREALEFFRPYKEDLGALWQQLVEVVKQHIGSF